MLSTTIPSIYAPASAFARLGLPAHPFGFSSWSIHPRVVCCKTSARRSASNVHDYPVVDVVIHNLWLLAQSLRIVGPNHSFSVGHVLADSEGDGRNWFSAYLQTDLVIKSQEKE